MPKKNFCVIIPAFNEEKVIESSLNALKKFVPQERVFVVSDGSTDQTLKLARRSGVKTMGLRKNVGKARAILKLIKSRQLTTDYKYILFSDADSRLDKNFPKKIRTFLKAKPACLVARVTSDRQGLISAFRTYEYALSHLVFKNAQNVIGTITVAPGCASFYRSDVLKKLNFKNNTLTEDFDLTLQIHQQKLGQIVLASQAAVVTQDPISFKYYWNQILRWHTGFWQNVFLHRLYLPTRKINLEILLLMLDMVAVVATIAYMATHPSQFLQLIALMYGFVTGFAILIMSFSKQFWAILYAPLFPLLYLASIISYFGGFFRALWGRHKVLSWKKVARYTTKA